jgi:hypothetical protein
MMDEVENARSALGRFVDVLALSVELDALPIDTAILPCVQEAVAEVEHLIEITGPVAASVLRHLLGCNEFSAIEFDFATLDTQALCRLAIYVIRAAVLRFADDIPALVPAEIEDAKIIARRVTLRGVPLDWQTLSALAEVHRTTANGGAFPDYVAILTPAIRRSTLFAVAGTAAR